MQKLTSDEIEDVLEILDFGFMRHVFVYKMDMASNHLSEDDIMSIINANANPDLFSNYVRESYPCELCGSHGKVRVDVNGKAIVIKDW